MVKPNHNKTLLLATGLRLHIKCTLPCLAIAIRCTTERYRTIATMFPTLCYVTLRFQNCTELHATPPKQNETLLCHDTMPPDRALPEQNDSGRNGTIHCQCLIEHAFALPSQLYHHTTEYDSAPQLLNSARHVMTVPLHG